MRLPLALVVIAGCGRISFSPSPDASPAAIDAMAIDALPVDAMPVSPIGCADGEREQYAELAVYPLIAACGATWDDELDLRAAPTGASCGDDLGPCASPADACSAGWHVCARSGETNELLALTDVQCAMEPGAWVAAADHCEMLVSGVCSYAVGPVACSPGRAMDCLQPICCGASCIAPMCRSAVWTNMTGSNLAAGPGCANTPGTGQDGVLCCRD